MLSGRIKIGKWAVILIVVVVLALGGGLFYGWKFWWPLKLVKIERGLASPNFPWRDFSEAELANLYPQIRYANVPTRVTPEETYAKFREALRTNNLELAIEQLAKEDESYIRNKTILEQAYKENRLQEAYEGYPEEIVKQSMYEALASYYYIKKENEHNLQQTIGFVKDANGDWKMYSL